MGSTTGLFAARDAYSLYLEARHHWNERTPESIREAIRCLEKAVLIDGTFALACAAMADCYSILMEYGVLSPREGMTAARLASGRALNHDPELAESLTSAALVRQMDLDWRSAEQGFKAAIEAHPGYPVARQRYALFLAWTGREAKSRREIEEAASLDPESPAVLTSAAWIDYYYGRFREAAEGASATLREHPEFTSAEAVLGSALVQAGRADEAVTALKKALDRAPQNVSIHSLLTYALARAGKGQEAETSWGDLNRRSEGQYVSPFYQAIALIGLERTPEALAALSQAEAERCPQLVYLGSDPIFAPLRGESAFTDLLDRIGLPAGEEHAGAAGRAGSKEEVA